MSIKENLLETKKFIYLLDNLTERSVLWRMSLYTIAFSISSTICHTSVLFGSQVKALSGQPIICARDVKKKLACDGSVIRVAR